jgi:hypothetical protein
MLAMGDDLAVEKTPDPIKSQKFSALDFGVGVREGDGRVMLRFSPALYRLMDSPEKRSFLSEINFLTPTMEFSTGQLRISEMVFFSVANLPVWEKLDPLLSWRVKGESYAFLSERYYTLLGGAGMTGEYFSFLGNISAVSNDLGDLKMGAGPSVSSFYKGQFFSAYVEWMQLWSQKENLSRTVSGEFRLHLSDEPHDVGVEVKDKVLLQDHEQTWKFFLSLPF